ncbi:Cytochrome c oxidase assembly protein COX15 [Trichoderma ghanense]|uniref:Cytochrome c oxidase assembly protein COX15 n=1 Tax=Trichoderma ghanense TaxID=65468 RepID=A0ABY2HFC8_9HYPO
MRRAALQMPSKFFVCNQCLLRQAPRRSPSPILNIIRSRGYADAKPLESLAAQSASALASEAQGQASRAFPKKTTSKAVAIWLLGSAASCFGIVVFGGLTRLTESGLSITEWRPVTGSLPPMSPADWESEFEKYRASPEFKLLNPHMTLDEFKKIYFMEWTHRLWGRFIGLSFVLPSLYFVARRRVSPRMALNLLGISSLIGFQGFIGWWMVKSGLKDDLFAPGSHPRVSQYRLTTHLATAFVCYSWMLLSGLTILRTRRMLADPVAASATIKAIRNPALNAFRRSVLGVAGLVFLTAMSGGLVAGLDAGLIYNEFPKMGLGLTPPKSELWDKFYARKEDGSDLWWRNMLENPSLVQLDHRILAVTTFCTILALFAYARTGRVAAALPRDAKKGTTGLVHLVSLQAALGISTLIYMVPTHLAATHQAGSLAVLTGALVLAHRLHVPKSTVRVIEQKLKQIKP